MLKILRLWKGRPDSGREFAFVHLFLNLKGRPEVDKNNRVPSEYISALGGIRTDLDQFSFIEREALMYHGYTLIDAQIKEHCENLRAFIGVFPKLEQPPLFRDLSHSDQATEQGTVRAFLGKVYRRLFQAAQQCDSETKLRKRVKAVVTVGSAGLFLWRSRLKYPKKSWLVFGPAFYALFDGWNKVEATLRLARWAWSFASNVLNISENVQRLLESARVVISQFSAWLLSVMADLIPDWVESVWEIVVKSFAFLWSLNSDTSLVILRVLTGIAWIVLWAYIVAFLTYEAMRWMVRRWDLEDYRSLTGEEPTAGWTAKKNASKVL